MPAEQDADQLSRRRLLATAAGATAAALVPGVANASRTSDEAHADLVLHAGKVWPGVSAGMVHGPAMPWAEAVAVRGQRIVAVGRDDEVLTWAGPRTRVVDLAGRFVMPGFRDQHTHLLGMAFGGAPADDYRPAFNCYDPKAAFEARRRTGQGHVHTHEQGETPMDQVGDGEVTDELKQSLLTMQDEIAKQGITTVVEAGMRDFALWKALVELAEEDLLKVRFLVRVAFGGMERAAERGLRTGVGNEWVKVLGVKNYADGWLGPRTSALRAPYDDDPYGFPRKGILFLDQDRADRDIARARELGFNVTTHAIGDRGVATALTAYERAGVTPADRWALEHVQVVGDDLVDRLAADGVIASYQLSFATTDARFARDALGKPRLRETAYRWATMQRRGVRLAGGSDVDVEVVDPLWGLQRAVTRQDFDGFPRGGFRRSEGLSLRDTLRTVTSDAAYASLEDHERGTIAVGNYADLVVLRENLLQIPHDRLASATREMTVTNGRIASEEPVSYPPDDAADCDPYPEE
ncbi:amidohydrolase [Solicola gregarius]|uniref:Amidohydrolase family protein n=1 Tax=Solicola gregarius TaxID=2908642 RepID=A0AA46TE51_9ACTN|nr:amidohydrolase family protein [Solicola gregarius]UYM03513.1 amidohydrolase family protein [Solicola gregarius]